MRYLKAALIITICLASIGTWLEPAAKPKRMFQVKERANWGAFSPDGQLFWTSSSERTFVRRTKNGKALFEIDAPVRSLRILEKGKRFLVRNTNTGRYRLLNQKGEVLVERLEDVVLGSAPDSKSFLIQKRIHGSRADCEFSLMAALDGKVRWKTELPGKARSAAVSKDGKVFAIAIHNFNRKADFLVVLEAKSGRVLYQLDRDEQIGELAISPNGKFVATKWRANRTDRYVEVVDWKAKKELARLWEGQPVGAPVWSGDGSLLGVTNYRRPSRVQLYSTKTWKKALGPFPHFRPWRFQFSGDGSLFLTWEWDEKQKNSTGILRSSEDGKELAQMTLPEAGYFRLSPDGSVAVEAAGRVAERDQVDLLARKGGQWTQHKLPGPMRSSQLGPDGRKLLVLHGPKGATMWDLSKIAGKSEWQETTSLIWSALR